MKKFLSLLLCIVMILSVCTTMAVAADGDETEATTDIRDTWWADPAWRAEFNAWCNNYYNDGVSSRTHVYEIGSVAELYAFWRVSLHRKSQYTGSNKGGFNTEDWTSITSRWSISAPARCTLFISFVSWEKSAARIEGAMCIIKNFLCVLF